MKRVLILLAVLVCALTALGTAEAQAGQNILTWVDNSSGDGQEQVFEIERKVQVVPPTTTPPAVVDCTTVTGTYAALATVQQNVVTYTDTAVSAGSIYCYQVRARGASGLTSAYSNQAGRYVPFVQPAAPSGLTVRP